MSHRHRHGVAGPPRRDHDRPGLLATGRWPRHGGSPAGRGRRRPTSSSRTCTTPRRRGRRRLRPRLHRHRRARAGCPTSAAGRRWWPTLLRPGGRLFIREGHPMLWALRPTGGRAAGPELPYFEHGGAAGLGRAAAPTCRPTPSSSTPPPTRGTTASARSSPRCSTPGLTITGLVEHDGGAVGGAARPDDRAGDGEWQLTDRPERLAHTYTLQAVRTPFKDRRVLGIAGHPLDLGDPRCAQDRSAASF